MTESHEPSYYEIALTNRQVVVAFVILLTCLMGTFVAGVWVGRGEAGPAAGRTAETGPEAPRDLEELDFFGGGPGASREDPDGAPEEGAAPAPTPREDPVVQRNRRQAGQDTGSRDPGAGADLAGGEGPALSDEAPGRLTPEERRRRRAARQAAAEAREPAAESPVPQPTPGAAAEGTGAVPSGGRLVEGPVVQVFSSRDREQAQAIVERLTDGGQPAYLSPVDVDGQTMYRVRIGPFRDRAQAERVAGEVKRAYRLDTWITQ